MAPWHSCCSYILHHLALSFTLLFTTQLCYHSFITLIYHHSLATQIYHHPFIITHPPTYQYLLGGEEWLHINQTSSSHVKLTSGTLTAPYKCCIHSIMSCINQVKRFVYIISCIMWFSLRGKYLLTAWMFHQYKPQLLIMLFITCLLCHLMAHIPPLIPIYHYN